MPSQLRFPFTNGHYVTSHKTRISKNTAARKSYIGQASSNLTLCLQQRIENRTNRRERNFQPDSRSNQNIIALRATCKTLVYV